MRRPDRRSLTWRFPRRLLAAAIPAAVLAALLLEIPSAAEDADGAAAPTVGLMPVEVPPVGQADMVRPAVEARLTQLARERFGPRLIGPERMGRWAWVMRLSFADRKELLAGQVAGADVLVLPRLVHRNGWFLLQLTAVRTATGERLGFCLETLPKDGEPAPIAGPFLAGLEPHLAAPTPAVDVALLPLIDKQHSHETSRRARHMRDRLADLLAAGTDGLRVLNPDVAEFVGREAVAAKYGLADPQRPHKPVRDPVTVEGRFDAPTAKDVPFEKAPYGLRFVVAYGGRTETVELSGTLAEGAKLENALANRLRQAVGRLTGRPEPEGLAIREKDRNYWQANRLIYQAAQSPLLEKDAGEWDLKSPEVHRLFGLVNEAAALLPDSEEPYWPVYDTLTKSFLFTVRKIDECPPLVVVRDRMLSMDPSSPMWIRAYEAMAANCGDSDAKRWESQPLEQRQRVVDLARRLAQAALRDGRTTCPRFPFALCRAGEWQLAVDAAVAASEKESWIILAAVFISALDEGWMDLAYDAYRCQLGLFPSSGGGDWLKQKGRLEKIRADADPARKWAALMPQAFEEGGGEEAFRNKWTQLPRGYGTFVTRRPTTLPVTYRLLEGGSILSIGVGGDRLWAMVRRGNAYSLWPVGPERTVPITGMPPLVPPNQIQGYVMRPSLAFFDGAVYVGAEHLGLYRVDPGTGEAKHITEGLPADAQPHALATQGGRLYAAGACGKDGREGFLACWESADRPPRLFEPPKHCGSIRRLDAGQEDAWYLFHDATRHVSRFRPVTGDWKDAFLASEYVFNPTLFAVTRDRALLAERGWDVQDPIYMVEHARNERMQPIYFPPPGLSEFQVDLGRHEWFLPAELRDPATVRVAPLAGYPADMVADDVGWVWILDTSGGLVATRDGRQFVGPLEMDGGQWLCRWGENLAIAGPDRVNVISFPRLRDVIGQAEPTESADLYRRTVAHLDGWLAKQPLEGRSAYYYNLRRYRQAAEAILQADRPLTPQEVRWAANLLRQANEGDRALDLLAKHGLEASPFENPEAEDAHFKALADRSQWEQILKETQELWRTAPLLPHGSSNYNYGRRRAYLMALEYALSPDDYERRLCGLVLGDLPEVKGGWDSSVVMAAEAWALRFYAAERLAWRLGETGRFRDILQHPLLGTRVWYQADMGSEWDLYLYVGQPERALEKVEYEGDQCQAHLYAEKYREALRFVPDKDHGDVDAYLKAALLAGDWTAYEEAARRLRAEQKPDEPHALLDLVDLLRRDPASFERWRAAFLHDFYERPTQAAEAYQECFERHPETPAGAEAAFRLGELLWLGQGRRDAAAEWFDRADRAYAALAEAGDETLPAYALFRRGLIARVVRENPPAAEKCWSRGSKLSGWAAELCRQATHGLQKEAPAVAVGTARQPPAQRVVEAEVGQGCLYVYLPHEYLDRNVRAFYHRPLAASGTLFEAWSDDEKDSWWSLWLWYKFSDIRPGIGMVYVQTPDNTETVWLLLKGKPAD